MGMGLGGMPSLGNFWKFLQRDDHNIKYMRSAIQSLILTNYVYIMKQWWVWITGSKCLLTIRKEYIVSINHADEIQIQGLCITIKDKIYYIEIFFLLSQFFTNTSQSYYFQSLTRKSKRSRLSLCLVIKRTFTIYRKAGLVYIIYASFVDCPGLQCNVLNSLQR